MMWFIIIENPLYRYFVTKYKGLKWYTILQAKFSQARIVVGSRTKLRPEQFSVFTLDGHVVDACLSPMHQAVAGKLPEFVSASPEPVVGIVVARYEVHLTLKEKIEAFKEGLKTRVPKEIRGMMQRAVEVLRNSSQMLNPITVGDTAPDFNLKNFNDTGYTIRPEPEETLDAMKMIV